MSRLRQLAFLTIPLCLASGRTSAQTIEHNLALSVVVENIEIETTGFGDDPMWHDGRAEVATYDATRSQYGQVWPSQVRMISVAEQLDAELMVKSDTPDSEPTLSVMKVHIIAEMPTHNYTYNFATSVFVDRDRPFVLRKLVTTSSEWCGITTKTIRPWLDPPQLEYESYFEAEGSGIVDLDWPQNGVTEEQLFFAVRSLPFQAGFEAPIRLLSRQVDSHARPPEWRQGNLRVQGNEMVEDAAGAEHQTWRIELTLENGDAFVYNVATEASHVLVFHSGPGDVTWRLREVERWAYWQW